MTAPAETGSDPSMADTGPMDLPAPAGPPAPDLPPPPDDDHDDLDDEHLPRSPGDFLRTLLASGSENEPFYPRLLRLRHVHPNGWQRAALFEGMVILGIVVALADRASWWTPVILPVAAAVVVKFNDVLVGMLPHRDRPETPNGGAVPEDDTAVGKQY